MRGNARRLGIVVGMLVGGDAAMGTALLAQRLALLYPNARAVKLRFYLLINILIYIYIGMQICDRKLRCRNHKCPAPCHR